MKARNTKVNEMRESVLAVCAWLGKSNLKQEREVFICAV